MNKISRLDFEGQQIYVGMDVHKKSWSISIFTEEFEHKTFTPPPEVGTLVNYLKRNFPGASYKSVYEAGYSGFWIHDRLQEHGVQCLVVNPADVPTKDKERKKENRPSRLPQTGKKSQERRDRGHICPFPAKGGRSEPYQDPTQHGQEADALQKPDQVYFAILRDPHTGRTGRQSLVQALHRLA